MTIPRADRGHAIRLKFRALLTRPELTVMPGGFSPLCARMAELAGFESFFVAGSQMSAWLLGVPDAGILGLRDVADHARHCAARVDIPIFVDCDTGFGNAANVHFTTLEIIRSGVAGMQIEDQESPKKSGTSAGRRCVPLDEAVGKIQAAVAARDTLDPAFVICARCDSLGAEGESFDSAQARGIAYAREGGADLVWLNSVETLDDLARFCAAVPAPVLAIWGGGQPEPSFEDYRKTGVKIMLYPVLASSAGMQAAWQTLHDFRARGQEALADWRASIHAGRVPAIDLKTLTGDSIVRDIEERFVPADQQRDYAGTWGHTTHVGGDKS